MSKPALANASKKLPPGWKWAKLGEVCKEDRHIIDPKSKDADLLSYLGLENIESQSGKLLLPNTSTKNEGISTTFRFDSHHVLYGKLRPYLNKVALPQKEGRCTTEIIPLLPNKDIDRTFLSWALRRPETVSEAMSEKTGSRMPRANLKLLFKMEIPLPPLPEQKRIAGILTKQMAIIEKAKNALDAQLEAAKSLPGAYLREVFPQPGQPLPSGWKWEAFTRVVTKVNLKMEKLQTKDYRSLGEYPIIDQGNKKIAGFTDNKSFVIQEPLPLVVFGDHTKIAKFVDYPFCLGADGVILLSTTKGLDLKFFYLWLSQAKLRDLGYARHFSILKKTEIPFPALSEQKRIAGILEKKISATEKLKSNLKDQLEIINKVPAAILRKAFNGEL